MHHNNGNLIRPRRVKVRSNLEAYPYNGAAYEYKSLQQPVSEKRCVGLTRCSCDLNLVSDCDYAYERCCAVSPSKPVSERYIDLTAPRDPRRSLPFLHFYYRSELLQGASDTYHLDSCCGGERAINPSRSRGCNSNTCDASPGPTPSSNCQNSSAHLRRPHQSAPISIANQLCERPVRAMSSRTLESPTAPCPLSLNARRNSKFVARCSRIAPIVAVWDCGGSTAPASTPAPFDGPLSGQCSLQGPAAGCMSPNGCVSPVGPACQSPVSGPSTRHIIRSCPLSPSSTASPSPLSTPVSSMPPGTDSEGSSPPGFRAHVLPLQSPRANSQSSPSRVVSARKAQQPLRPSSLKNELFFGDSRGGRSNALTPDVLSRLVHTPDQRNCSPLVRHERAESFGREQHTSIESINKFSFAVAHKSHSARASQSECDHEDEAAVAVAMGEVPISSSNSATSGRRPLELNNLQRVSRPPQSPRRKPRSSSGTPTIRLQAIDDSNRASDGDDEEVVIINRDGLETRPSSALEGNNAEFEYEQQETRGTPVSSAAAKDNNNHHNSQPSNNLESLVRSDSMVARIPHGPESSTAAPVPSPSPSPSTGEPAHCVSPVSPRRRPSRLLGLLPTRTPTGAGSGPKLPPATARRAQQLGLDSCTALQNARSVPDVPSAVDDLTNPRALRSARRSGHRPARKQHPFARLGDKLGLRGALPYIELYLVYCYSAVQHIRVLLRTHSEVCTSAVHSMPFAGLRSSLLLVLDEQQSLCLACR